MKLKLNVSFKDNEQVKNLGAKWDWARRIWYIELPKEFDCFSEWIDESVLVPENYKNNVIDNLNDDGTVTLFTEIRENYPCYNCGKGMDIIQLFPKKPKNMEFTKSYEYTMIFTRPYSFVAFAKSQNIKMRFQSTKVIKEPYAIHVCPYCGSVQGDNFIFMDKDCKLAVKEYFITVYDPKKEEWSRIDKL